MKRSRFSEEQIIGVLKEAEATTVKGTCAKYNISDATYYNWKRKYGRIDVDEARRLRAPEDENGRDWWPSCRSRIRSSKRSIQKNGKSVKPSTGRERHSRTSALRAQTIPPNQWEFLIVDNASDERLSEFWDLSWHPRARHIRENNLGLTAARLRGMKESSGELAVFVDDDNVLAPDFLEQARVISARYPHLGVFGAGNLEPEFEVQPSAEETANT